MKYKSDIPNLYIMGDIIYDNGTRDRVELGKFDENGYLETDDYRLINRLRELGYKPINEEPKESEEPKKAEDSKVKCKQCGLEFDNKGLLMAHYRTGHPKK